MTQMTIIKEYETGYIDRNSFLDHLFGSGQQLINREGVERFMFYINSANNDYDSYYIIPFY